MSRTILASLIALFIAVRCALVLRLPIADCDETYNFVEPIHYLLYGYGMQTWEYSQQFALRSYGFLWLYAGPAKAVQFAVRWLSASTVAQTWLVDDEALMVYFGYRMVTAVVAVCCELYFVGALPLLFHFTRHGPLAQSRALRLQSAAVLLLLLASPSVGHASFSTLPTSFCMSLYFVALGGWIRLSSSSTSRWSQRPGLVVVCVTVVAAIGVMGWPFALLLAVPMASHFAWRAFRWSVVGAAIAVCACACLFLLDGVYYCKPLLCAACNIVAYNVFGAEGRGAELYGVESWDYFIRNLLLQWNVLFVLAAVVFPLIVVWHLAAAVLSYFTPCRLSPSVAEVTREMPIATSDVLSVGWYGSAFFIWFVFWTRIPHKEERFMVPAYPFLFLAAFAVLVVLWPTAVATRQSKPIVAAPPRWSAVRRAVVVATVIAFGVVSYGRTAAMESYYGQPQAMWGNSAVRNAIAHKVSSMQAPFTVCVGKEWYRFPTHFFLPHATTADRNVAATYQFLRTRSFSGALPKPFPPPEDGSCVARVDMNDLNTENSDQFVANAHATCDVVWDTIDAEGPAVDRDGWTDDVFASNVVTNGHAEYRLLDPSKTPLLCRALHFPFLPYYQRCAHWHTMVLRSLSATL